MPRRLSYRKPRFKVSQHEQSALDDLPPRLRRTATHVLHLIGQWCVDKATDGRVSEADLRGLHDFCEWRIMESHVARLVACGVLTDLGQGDYQLAHFHENHAPAWLQERRVIALRVKDRVRKRKTFGFNPRQPSRKSRTCASIPTITYGSIVGDQITNQEPPSSEIESPPVTSQTEADDFTAMTRRLKAKAEAMRAAAPEPSPAEPQPEPPTGEPQPQRRPPARLRKPARMPKEQRPVHEGDVAAAVKRLHLGPELVPTLHNELAKIRATDADVGYALRAIKHSPSRIRRVDRYLIGVIKNQQRQRLASAGFKSVGS